MNILKKALITKLRDKKITRIEFRAAAERLTHVLAHEAVEYLESKNVSVQTPLAEASGVALTNNIVLVAILRSGLVMLPTFLHYFPRAAIGFVGLKRDEQTALPNLYYENLPQIKKEDQIIMLDPMLATGGTAAATLEILKAKGVEEKKILFVSIISAPDGIFKVNSSFPNVKLLVAAEDEKLNKKFFIIPGLGDFGDRYFGTE